MELLVASALVVGGLGLLTVGGEALVRGATAISQLVGLPPAIIGLSRPRAASGIAATL